MGSRGTVTPRPHGRLQRRRNRIGVAAVVVGMLVLLALWQPEKREAVHESTLWFRRWVARVGEVKTKHHVPTVDAASAYSFPGEHAVFDAHLPHAVRLSDATRRLFPDSHGNASWRAGQRRLQRASFPVRTSSGFEGIEAELERTMMHPARHRKDELLPRPLRRLGVIVVALTAADLDASCRHIEKVLPSLMHVTVQASPSHGRPPRAGDDRHDESRHGEPLLGLLAVAGPATASWAVCAELLDAASFAVELVPAAVPSFTEAVQTAASHFESDTSHVLVVEARNGRVETVVTAASLGRIATLDTTGCGLFSCVDFDVATGVVESAGLDTVVNLDGELRHYHVAHFGGFHVDALARRGTPNATDAVGAPILPPMFDVADVHRRQLGLRRGGVDADSFSGGGGLFSGGAEAEDAHLSPAAFHRASIARVAPGQDHWWYFNTQLVKPTCMLALRDPLMRIAIPRQFAPKRKGSTVESEAPTDAPPLAQHTSGQQPGVVAQTRVPVVSVKEARESLRAALAEYEGALLSVTVEHVGANVKAASTFRATMQRGAEWSSAAVDLLRDSFGGMTRAEPYTPRSVLSEEPPLAAHNMLLASATHLAGAVVTMWEAQRTEEIEAARRTPAADSGVELALRLSPAGHSCTSPLLTVPVESTSASGGFSAMSPLTVNHSMGALRPISVGAADYNSFKLSSYLTMRAGQQLRGLKPEGLPVIAWFHLCCHCCGFSNEIVHLTVPLQRRYPLMMMAEPTCFCDGFNTFTTAVVNGSGTAPAQYMTHRNQQEPVIWISHTTPMHYNHHLFECNPPSYLVGRSMFEFSVVPSPWLTHSAVADEIWVPATFVLDAFLASGFDRKKLYIVPEAIDTELYSPHRPERYVLPHCTFKRLMNDSSNIASNAPFPDPIRDARAAELGAPISSRGSDPFAAERLGETKHYKFLSSFKWELRKGWDVLLRGFFRAFTADDKVSLYIVTSIFATEATNHKHSRDAAAVLSWVFNVSDQMGIDRGRLPHIVVITAALEETEVATLYRSADAFVLPTRGEGWGLPVMQAMASGLPTISTNYSGQVDFMAPGTCYPIRVERLEQIPFERVGVLDANAAMQWAVPDEAHMVALLREVHAGPEAAMVVGRRASAHIAENYSEEAVFRLYVEPHLQRIQRIIRDRPPGATSQFVGRVDC